MDRIDEIVKLAHEAGASDVHIAAGRPPVCRIDGLLLAMGEPGWPEGSEIPRGLSEPVTSAAAEAAVRRLTTDVLYRQFQTCGECDFAYSIEGVCRCRVNAFKHMGAAGLAIRLLKQDIPSLAELGLPKILASLARKRRGLILVTGAAGSGKSTTMAAMIDLINREEGRHIITLEDPVEYIHRPQKSLITQREIGSDSQSFKGALRAALREDPDVILVGEMRDPETIAIALTAAETGHLVLGALHTAGAAQGVDRVQGAFPPHQLPQIRAQLSNTLLGITSQMLLPAKTGRGRVAVMEVMIANLAIRNLIREGKTYQIINQMQTGAKYGMQTMEIALLQAIRLNQTTKEVALSRAADYDPALSDGVGL